METEVLNQGKLMELLAKDIFLPKQSASERKIKLFKSADKDNNSASDINMLINFGMLQKFISSFSCSVCHQKTLECCNMKKKNGIVEILYSQCTSCGDTGEQFPMSPRMENEKAGKAEFLLNKRIVTSFISNGQSYSGLDHICGALNMRSMTHQTFDQHANEFKEASITTAINILQESCLHVRQCYKEMNPSISLHEDDVADILVSYEGSWRKRGHVSHQGIGVVIHVNTGLVLDYEILCTYCPKCTEILKQKKELTDTQRKELVQEHKEAGECQINYYGSANGMEVEAALRMWKRSVQIHKLRYTTMLSDGDAKTFAKLLEANPYDGIQIEKEECVNHVTKRMGTTSLRKLVAEQRSQGVTLGGRGVGKLTNVVIDRLSYYYGKAIRENVNNLEDMRSAIWGTFLHIISTDEKPLHHRCPHGTDSYCFYNKSVASKETPGLHIDHLGTSLTPEVAEKVKAVYSRLIDPNLLQRCLRGETQNSNESLHSKIWSYCPKVSFSGRRLLDQAVAHAVAEWNAGAHSLSKTFQLMNVTPGKHTQAHHEKRDRERLCRSRRQAEEATKEKRILRKRARAQQQDALDKQEGHLYEAGGGDTI